MQPDPCSMAPTQHHTAAVVRVVKEKYEQDHKSFHYFTMTSLLFQVFGTDCFLLFPLISYHMYVCSVALLHFDNDAI